MESSQVPRPFDYKNTNTEQWGAYEQYIDDNIKNIKNPFSTRKEIDTALKFFGNLLKQARDKNIPRIQKQNRRKTRKTNQLTVKADEFAKAYEKFHKKVHDNTHPNDNKIENFSIQSKNIPSEKTWCFSPTNDDVKNIIVQLNPFKATGDGTACILFKHLPSSAIEKLTEIFTACFQLNYHPFKESKAVPIHKDGKNKNHATSYRLIHILDGITKIFDKILSNLVKEKAIKNPLIPKGNSAEYLVKQITNFVNLNRKCGKSTILVHLDATRAYESVSHDVLIYKLKQLKFPPSLCELIKSFIDGRYFHVHANGARSKKVNVLTGLIPGSPLSSVLYDIYTYDIPKRDNIKVLKYADDVAVLCAASDPNESINTLNSYLEDISEYFAINETQINVDKTNAILFPFSDNGQRELTVHLKYNESEIPLQDTIKYLGITLDKMLTFKDHISTIQEKKKQLLIEFEKNVIHENRTKYYLRIVRPKIVRASTVWFFEMSDIPELFDSMQDEFLKFIPERKRSNIEPLSQYLRRRHNQFLKNYPQQNYINTTLALIDLISFIDKYNV